MFFVLFILYSRQIYRYSSLVSGWDGLIQSLDPSEELLQATWNCDENAVANGIAAIHHETSSMRSRKRDMRIG